MNNTQFRRLVLDTPVASKNDGSTPVATTRQNGATPSALGSRMHSSIPMTPRSVGGISHNDFTRQLAERNAELHGTQAKKSRASTAPKGTKLAFGYQDRTKTRVSEEDDDKAIRIRALEEMVKLGQMDETTFQKLRDEIVSGDAKNTHLVKGLDYRLLERVRRGEDVLADQGDMDDEALKAIEPSSDVNVDNELEELEVQELSAPVKEERQKRGLMAPPPPVAGKKRTRDDILKELKAARVAAAAEAKALKPSLGSKFKRVGSMGERSRLEKDEQGREILILVDADGNVKRKMKKTKTIAQPLTNSGLLMPDKSVAPLGMEVTPSSPVEAQPEDELDIFEGVGTDFNPLGDIMSDEVLDSDGDNTDEGEVGTKEQPIQHGEKLSVATERTDAENDQARNYFNDSRKSDDPASQSQNILADPTFLAAFKKASKLKVGASMPLEDDEDAIKIARHRKLLESGDRDAEDMDMGFGSSRFHDEDDVEEGRKGKLSIWGQNEGDTAKAGKEKRKRGPKKRKGDGENASDVLKVLERRKGEKR
ncbi:uncharacterized protein KY384_002529 [Bacidia gigantensis]|uniref:uncharacterized protein n=1 Tax=Bacidia gigantensis TaxID=2732470 RepID=UPI001D05472B|nr:uncharacterized protein KY384_002529 [Bacidia gigantensis]KAG8532652.1 hypothetical protein KY384_002529 [Bacidia gigantensis]